MIDSIYILDNEDTPLIIYDSNGSKKSESEYQMLVAKLTESLRLFASDLKDHLCHFEIGNKKYHYTMDNISGVKFIVISDKEMREKELLDIMQEIKNHYINTFIGSSLLTEREIADAKDRVKKKIEDLTEGKRFNSTQFLLDLNQ
ncbi:MAG: hypothetical protein BAJALOKI1v1_1060001 [Promethearchaeota archaeon]|nr:MAG: hypothetical protein BAJALOKI1v1_1060001 [Candidatus Lokiarchaeota archaeon]